MAKAPRTGRVKTRLHGLLGADRATALYDCFLRDTLALAVEASATRGDLDVALCYAHEDSTHDFDGLLPGGATAIVQRGEGLGERVENCFRDLFVRGARSVVVVGADSPSLPPSVIADALDALASRADVALGPTTDGGYYLVGARAVHAELFRDIAWSTDRVFVQTMERAAASGLSVSVLPEWYDVDEPADLDRLRADVSAGARVGARTRRFLENA
jgi:rSAM/selenodomain-associated transferase 1